MRSVPMAMIWELLWHGRACLIAGFVGANAMPAILLLALRQDGYDPRDPSSIMLHFMLVQLNMFIFGAAILTAQGPLARLYAFPVTSWTMVTWRMLPVMVLAAIELLVSTLALNAMFDVGWPLWGPAMFAAVAAAAMQSVLWLAEKSGWVVALLTAVFAVLGFWFKSRYGAINSQPSRLWMEVTPLEVAVLTTFGLIAFGVAGVAVSRNRRGDPLRSLGIVDYFNRVFDAAPEDGASLRTPADAQFWFEWRSKGWALPAVVVFVILALSGGWLIFSRDTNLLFQSLTAGGAFLSLWGAIVGMVIGNAGPNDSTFEMGQFLATRPITSTGLARAVLKMAAKGVMLSWAIWALSLLAMFVMLSLDGNPPQLSLPEQLGWWYFPATLLGPWIVMTILASAGLTGRSRRFIALVCGLIALYIGTAILSQFLLSQQDQLQLTAGAGFACGAVFVLGTTWMLWTAWRRGLIGPPTICVGASVWLALTALIAIVRMQHPETPLHVYALVVGLAALAVAPLASAPLAVAWNRTR